MPFDCYHEPFVGGGALFFELYRQGLLPEGGACLSDANERLIVAYRAVRDDVERVIRLLNVHKARHGEDYYYRIRAHVPRDPIEQGARIIYLNKTCYNGLFRENSRGEFNVPMGRYVNPMICDAENLRAVSEALRTAEVTVRPFEAVLDHAAPGDFVYFDPPYQPVSRTASFTGYAKDGFDEDDQRRLAEVFAALDRQGVKVLLSNSYTPLILELYRDYCIDEVFANRAVNSRADRRGKVSEALVRNY